MSPTRSLLLPIMILLLAARSSMSEVIQVPLGGDIQAAIDSAQPDDTIQLEAGTYEISSTLVTNVPLTLIGVEGIDGEPLSTIDAGRRCSIIVSKPSLDVRHLVLKDGMTLFDEKKGGPDGDPCEYAGSGNGGAILANGPLSMRGCSIIGCRAANLGGAIYARQAVELIDCILRDNAARYGGGISSQSQIDSDVISMTDCMFESLAACTGAVLHLFRTPAAMTGCTVVDSRGSALFYNQTVGRLLELESSIICDNNAIGLDYGALDYRFDEDSFVCGSLDDTDGDGVPDDCADADHTVAALVRAALDAGAQEVVLPPGEFRLAAPLALGSVQTPFTIRGDSESSTTLSGRGVLPIILVSQTQSDWGVLATGIRLEDGHGMAGGGISCFFSSVRCENVTIAGCSATSGGGAYGYSTDMSLSDTRFESCRSSQGAAIMATSFSSIPEAISVDFIDCTTEGPGSVVSLIDHQGMPRFVGCQWRLGSASEFSAISVAPEDDFPASMRGSLEQCGFEYDTAGQIIFPGTFIWDSVDCTFSSCCPFESPVSMLFATESDLIWRCDGCIGDVTCDGEVTPADLGRLLAAWGTSDHRFDLDLDGIVRAPDLGVMLTDWGLCD